MNASTSDKQPLAQQPCILDSAQSTVGSTLARTRRAASNTTTSTVLAARCAQHRCPRLAWCSWRGSGITSRLRGLAPSQAYPDEPHRALAVIRRHPVAQRRLDKAVKQVVAR